MSTKIATFRKTKQGEWVAFGPADVVKVGTVTITKANGETKVVEVERVGRDFTANGTTCRYGYIAERRARRDGSFECDECGVFVRPGTQCWETGCIH